MSKLARGALALSGVLALALPAASAGATPTVSGSGHISINDGSGWTQDPTAPLFDFTRIAPGWTATKTLGVRNDSDAKAALALRTANVDDEENGCNHPESFIDATCTGDNAGELGSELVLTIYGDANQDGTFDSSPSWSGSVRDLEQPDALGDLAAGASHEYQIVADLPYSSGNETQTDQVQFDLTVSLDGATVAVEGTKTTRSHGSGPVQNVIDQLPFTGTPAQRMAAAALSLVLAGTVLVLAATTRRRAKTG